ncbi:MAG: bifunctional anthranilate synthase component II/anthranilate phosphoribosyltransferase [Anaerolineae bacterium]
MIVVIDNYDSFTYNLVQYLGELGGDPWVFRNDRVTIGELLSMQPSHIVISPGPGTPERDAGISNQVIARFHGKVPILGVCLGHQCIGHHFGARVARAPRLMHGKVSHITHLGDRLFDGIPTRFEATRYHSLIVEGPLPDPLQALAHTSEGEIMALRHRNAPTYGVQFHPESILSPDGKRLLRNFMALKPGGAAQAAEGERAAEEAVAITLPQAIERALDRAHLSAAEAEALMGDIMAGEATPAQIGAYLAALRAKGETVAEITGFARAMRRHAVTVRPNRQPLVDTCGTGGDGAHTFNISTTAAFVVAGAGLAVAKHGNRSVSSRCGSADVLRELGANLDLPPERVAACIDEVGLGFLYAPQLHPAMRHAIGPRREMGVRTVFNVLGPLTNPAGAGLQVVGVYDRELAETLALVLRELGSDAAGVVSSADGLDELSTAGPNHLATLREGHIALSELDPATLGLASVPRAALEGGDATENARITREVLAGQRGPKRDVVLLNAALALHLAGAATDLPEGLQVAAASIDGGQAARVLENLVAFGREAS